MPQQQRYVPSPVQYPVEQRQLHRPGNITRPGT